MHADVSANTRIHLAQSLPLVEREEDTIVSRIAANLARASGRPTNIAQQGAAEEVIACLIDEARSVVDTGRFAQPRVAREARHSLEEEGYELSLVGDALVPILRDVFGPAVPHQAAGAWSTVFWAVFGRERAGAPELVS